MVKILSFHYRGARVQSQFWVLSGHSVWPQKKKSGGLGEGFKRKEIYGIYVYLRLIHIVLWQKPTQPCKAIILQLKN